MKYIYKFENFNLDLNERVESLEDRLKTKLLSIGGNDV